MITAAAGPQHVRWWVGAHSSMAMNRWKEITETNDFLVMEMWEDGSPFYNVRMTMFIMFSACWFGLASRHCKHLVFLPFHLQSSQTGSRTDASRCWEWNGRENLADDIIRVIGESGSQPTDRAREGERTGPAPKCSHSDLYVSGSLPRWPTRRDDRPRERSRCSPPHIFPGPEFSQTPHPFHGDTRPMY